MLRVPIHQARPGMKLALPIVQPKRPGFVLLHAGFELDQHEIDRLREIEVREAWIHVPGLEFIAQYINPAMVQRHAEVTRSLTASFDAIRERQYATLDYSEYKQNVSGLIESILESPRASVFVQELADRESDLIRHASSVCLISLLMGLRLDAYLLSQRRQLPGLQAKSVVNLGIGAMLHDVGMLRLAPETLDRWNKLRDEKDPAWRLHTQLGFEMLQGHISPTAASALLHHHQKFDGSGFPTKSILTSLKTTTGPAPVERALSRQDIHIFARIIACADLFDRERHTIAGEVPVVRALGRMLRPPISKWIDPTVMRALLAVVPAFAPGTMVTLNTGQFAAVCNWFSDDPCRPSVLMLDGETETQQSASITPPTRPAPSIAPALANPIVKRAIALGDNVRAAHLANPPHTHIGGDTPKPGDRVNLKSCPDLWITHAQGEPVEADCFYPQYPGEFDLALGGSRPFDRPPVPMDHSEAA
jgi:HD-GYP domain-containing protein (c-di-GMP phosphodiesterase class II)